MLDVNVSTLRPFIPPANGGYVWSVRVFGKRHKADALNYGIH